MGSIELLRQVAPNWVEIESQSPNELLVSARIVRAGGERSREYKLKLTTASSTVAVWEQTIGSMLPRWCPERHINPDGSFCLGLRAGAKIEDLSGAASLWRKVEVFLECQEVAHNTGRWPRDIQLSHGEEAAEFQLRAEKIAELSGLSRQLDQAIYFDEGPIADALRRRSTGRLRNVRSKCVCERRNKKGKLLLRKECEKHPDECLVALEGERRKAVQAFWNFFSSEKCCGSISDCPLAKGDFGE